MRFYTLLGNIIYSCFFCLFSGCATKKMDEKAFRAYLRDLDNGLVKTVSNNNSTIEVAYYPSQLTFKKSSGDDVIPVSDSIDHFIVRFESRENPVSPSQVDVYASRLLVLGDTLEALDALIMPGANMVSRNFSVMYAYKSFLCRRPQDTNVVFFVDRNYSDTRAEFSVRDIRSVKDIELR